MLEFKALLSAALNSVHRLNRLTDHWESRGGVFIIPINIIQAYCVWKSIDQKSNALWQKPQHQRCTVLRHRRR